MKLGEKIQYCRKKKGLSQDALAELVGVSRQAISKWELGEAMPEISNLAALAKIFGVTVDWLISEDEIEEEPENTHTNEDHAKKYDAFFDSWTGFAGRFLKRFGWLAGVYLALCGAGVSLVGVIAKVAVSVLFLNVTSVQGTVSSVVVDEFGNLISSDVFDPFGTSQLMPSVVSNNPVSIMANFFIVIGIVLIVGGTVLAIYLKRKGNK